MSTVDPNFSEQKTTLQEPCRKILSLGALCELSSRLKNASVFDSPEKAKSLKGSTPHSVHSEVIDIAEKAFSGNQDALLDALSSPLDFVDHVGNSVIYEKDYIKIAHNVDKKNRIPLVHSSLVQRTSTTTLASANGTSSRDKSSPDISHPCSVSQYRTTDTVNVIKNIETIRSIRSNSLSSNTRGHVASDDKSQCSSKASSAYSNRAAVDRVVSHSVNIDVGILSGTTEGKNDVWRNVRDNDGMPLFFRRPEATNFINNRNSKLDTFQADNERIASRVRRFYPAKNPDNGNVYHKKKPVNIKSNSRGNNGDVFVNRKYNRDNRFNNRINLKKNDRSEKMIPNKYPSMIKGNKYCNENQRVPNMNKYQMHCKPLRHSPLRSGGKPLVLSTCQGNSNVADPLKDLLVQQQNIPNQRTLCNNRDNHIKSVSNKKEFFNTHPNSNPMASYLPGQTKLNNGKVKRKRRQWHNRNSEYHDGPKCEANETGNFHQRNRKYRKRKHRPNNGQVSPTRKDPLTPFAQDE